MIVEDVLIQANAGQAVTVAAALPGVPSAGEAAGAAGPDDVIARARAHDTGELGRLVVAGVQAPGGLPPAMSCPVVHR